MLPLTLPLWELRVSQEEGTATTSFVSEALQTVAPEKLMIEDEEIFMQVAMQMYAGMLFALSPFSSNVLAVMSDNTLV
jgi:hypothetical protein